MSRLSLVKIQVIIPEADEIYIAGRQGMAGIAIKRKQRLKMAAQPLKEKYLPELVNIDVRGYEYCSLFGFFDKI
jgi:hypothetical protein